MTAQGNQSINYIRNSVKATVDAYDGTVSLYQWDEKDPVLATWSKAFPGTIQPKSKNGILKFNQKTLEGGAFYKLTISDWKTVFGS